MYHPKEPGAYQESYMLYALQQAKIAYHLGEIPVGAVLVQGDSIVSFACNRRETDKNALAHAEILAINQACRALGGWRLPNTALYVTLEPCAMCAGAILQARVEKVIFGVRDPKGGAFGSVLNFARLPHSFHPAVYEGVCAEESAQMLSSFFTDLRKSSKKKTP